MQTPLLLRPRIWSLRNELKRGIHSYQQLSRNLILLFVVFGVMAGIYYLSRWSLKKFEENDLVYLDPVTIFGLIFLFLFSVLILSGSAQAYGALFLSKDLDMLFASPISRFRLFIGRFIEIFLETCCVILLMLIPLIIAFGLHYAAPPIYYLSSIFLIIPFCLIPVALGLIVATLLAYFIPPHRARYVVYAVLAFCISGISFILHFAITIRTDANKNLAILFRVTKLFSTSNSNWMPSLWLAHAMSDTMSLVHNQTFLYVALLFCVATASVSGAFLLVSLLHSHIYLGHYVDNRTRKNSRLLTSRNLRKFLPFVSLVKIVMFEKELKTTMRDSLQMLHILLLGGICSTYLYFLSFQNQLANTDDLTILLVMMNAMIESFVVIAACTRFAFPSISLEGKSYWVLRVSPISLRKILVAKIFCWTLLLGLSTSTIFAIATYSINGYGGLTIAITKFFLNLGVSYGLVSLALCCGACFAKFDWDHESQLAASFGSIVFMLLAIVYANCMLFFTWTLAMLFNSPLFGIAWIARCFIGGGITISVWAINFYASKVLVSISERSLLKREELDY